MHNHTPNITQHKKYDINSLQDLNIFFILFFIISSAYEIYLCVIASDNHCLKINSICYI